MPARAQAVLPAVLIGAARVDGKPHKTGPQIGDILDGLLAGGNCPVRVDPHSQALRCEGLSDLRHIGIHERLTPASHEDGEHAQPAALGRHVPGRRHVRKEVRSLVRVAAEGVRGRASAVTPVRTQRTTRVAQC